MSRHVSCSVRSTVADPLSQVTTLGYDANDNRVSMQDASKNTSTFTFDKLNRLTNETDPLGKSLTYAYDDAGRLASTKDRQGRQRAFGFDAANQKTSEAWYAAGGALVQTQMFGYDDAGYLVSANDPDGNYTIGRDALNRASAVATPGGVTLAFGFDAAGNRTSVSDSTGGVQTSTFDLANRLTSRSLDAPTGGDLRVDYTYTDRNERKSMTRFSDLAGTTKVGDSSYTFDAGGRLTTLQNRTGSSAVIGDYTYQYDLDNRLTQKTENGVSTSFAYDKLGQVTTANGTSLSYDATGNRTNSGYVTAGGNRVTSDGTWTFGYDLDGNQVGKSKTGESWSYAYDHRGQMTQATSDTGVSVTYKFDAFGNRIGRDAAVNGVSSVEKFVVDGWDTTKPGAVGTENFDTILDLDGAGTVTNRRLFGSGFDDVVGRQDSSGSVKWYATDRLGPVRQVFDNAGNVSGTTDDDAFGGFLDGVSVDRYAFTGREVDAPLGLQYSRGRMYDSATGRWMGEDPIRQAAGDANLYRYVGNGATNARDPSGQEGWSLFRPLDWRFQTWDEINQSAQNRAEAGGQAVGDVVTSPLGLVAPEVAKVIATVVANDAKNAAAKGVEVAKVIHEKGKNLEAAFEKQIGEAAKGAIEPLVKEVDGEALRDLGDGIKKEVDNFRQELQGLERVGTDSDAALWHAIDLFQNFAQRFAKAFVQELLDELNRPDTVDGVGANGLFGGLLPFGDFRDALHNFQNNRPALGMLHFALGLSDVFGGAFAAKRLGKRDFPSTH